MNNAASDHSDGAFNHRAHLSNVTHAALIRQDPSVNVFNVACERLGLMLCADSDDRSQTSDQC